ncbi:MAG: hypothetical protein PQJ50_10265 [Spirochaetales bacterium]|nr:hypothetical protein [Spirochaetales bacterium]
MKNTVKKYTLTLLLILLPLLPLAALDSFDIASVYLQDYIRNKAGSEYRLHGPAVNVSFKRDGKLDLLFSVTSGVPIALNQDGNSFNAFDHYRNPSSFHLLFGPVWTFPMGDTFIFEPSLGLQVGFIQLKGTGYQTVQFAPMGIGSDLKIKARLNDRLILGLLAGFEWNMIDLLHYADHDTGYSLKAGISLGFEYDSGRVLVRRREGDL